MSRVFWRCCIPLHSSLHDAHSSLESCLRIQLGTWRCANADHHSRAVASQCLFCAVCISSRVGQRCEEKMWAPTKIAVLRTSSVAGGYTVKLFVRVLLEHSVFCWQGNANKMNYSDTILLAEVFRHCVAHHNSLIRRWSFRFHCRQQ